MQPNDHQPLDRTQLERWVDDPHWPVALHLREDLEPVDGEGGVFFPPTYAPSKRGEEAGYNIDTLSDGTKVALIDSVGSQANRIEPLFEQAPFSSLVPQIRVEAGDGQTVALTQVGHRLGDALMRCTELRGEIEQAFATLRRTGNAAALAKVGPTSLVFGVWDSRASQAKLPRILQSTVRAWEVSKLTRSAQYSPPLDYSALEVFSEDEKVKQEGDASSKLAQRGFVAVPATHTHGGVVARGPIRRDLSLNLVALRRLRGADAAETTRLRRYILGLALVAAAEPVDAFFRQGCLLVPKEGVAPQWTLVGRDGSRVAVSVDPAALLASAQAWKDAFGPGPDRAVQFDKDWAKVDIAQEKKPGKEGKDSKEAKDAKDTKEPKAGGRGKKASS